MVGRSLSGVKVKVELVGMGADVHFVGFLTLKFQPSLQHIPREDFAPQQKLVGLLQGVQDGVQRAGQGREGAALFRG